MSEPSTNNGIIITGGTVTGPTAAGPNAQAISYGHPQLGALDLQLLAGDLGKLTAALRKEATAQEHDEAVVEVGKAKAAAESGHRDLAFSHLKKAGKWALDVATKIGVSVASDALKQLV